SRPDDTQPRVATAAAPSATSTAAAPAPAMAVATSGASLPVTNGEGEKTEEQRQLEALEMVLEIVEALFQDREGALWGSMVKQTLKRKRPNFSERFHGYRTFNDLIEDAVRRGQLDAHFDEKSGGYLITAFGPNA
ncbi:MAG: OST-HTH/LOTUS domain-containing protein, partial [Myxococcota bacterium]|nr:OST-HTH/LOTUS domain-containing protein [Myxococcota bacterium]